MVLTNKVILVTGSHAGIGFAIAQKCQERGARVVVHARKEAHLQRALANLDDDAVGLLGDLATPSTPSAMIAETIDRCGRIDGLVNNAAIIDRSTIDDVTAESIDRIFAVNVRAPLLLIQAALPHLEQSDSAAIVNIGSINAHCGAPNLLTYSASKAAMMAATRNMGDAFGARPVRINQINVGWTLTENERKLQKAEGRPDNWLDLLPKEFAPRGMILKPEEIAEHAVFWLSDASKPATGQVYELEQYPVIGRNRISTR